MTQYPYHFLETLINDVYAWRQEDPANTIALLAEEVGVRPNVAYNWFEWNEDGDSVKTPIPVAKLIDVCNYIGRYNALQVLCEAANGFFTKHPQVDLKDKLSLFEQVATLYKTTVNLDKAFRDAIADGKMTPKELNTIIKTATENMAADQRMVECARKMLERGERK